MLTKKNLHSWGYRLNLTILMITWQVLLVRSTTYQRLLSLFVVIHYPFKDPVLQIKHCTQRSLGGYFCDAENSEAFVCRQNSTRIQ